jgi:hypothetical protein
VRRAAGGAARRARAPARRARGYRARAHRGVDERAHARVPQADRRGVRGRPARGGGRVRRHAARGTACLHPVRARGC